MKKIYVIFKFEYNQFVKPEVFSNAEDYNERMEALAQALRDNLDGDVEEWNEIGGREMVLRCTDTIYRGYVTEIPETAGIVYLYADSEDDDYFQIGHVEVTTDKQERDIHYGNKNAEWLERVVADKDYNPLLVEFPETGNIVRQIALQTENGHCGHAEFSAMQYDVVLN